jgi:predicted phosphodiesterase
MKLGIISDIHGNWPALEAVVRQAKKVDGFLCLGDIVNYGPHPVQCVEWVQKHVWSGWIVQGNHDRALGLDEDPRCSEPYREMAAAMQAYTASQLNFQHKEYLASLPVSGNLLINDAKVVFFHAAPSDPLYAYVPKDDSRQWSDETVFAHHPDFLLVGHTHTAFVRQYGETTVINPGSVGQTKDGSCGACYAIWDGYEVELCQADYDVKSVIRDLQPCAPEPIVQRLSKILLTGGRM